jgi:ADP-heptose:LPS heptosyltransferase
LRIGTSHRWYHWATCNELEHFSRKRSNLHEAQLNIRLARRLLGDVAPSIDDLARLTTLEPRVPLPPDVETLLDPSLTMVVLHPGSGGSGREWPLDRWHDLAWSLEGEALQLLISGSQAERLALEPWLATLPPHAVDIMGRLELAELIALLARVDGMVAASTGPLHLAAALGRHTLGLYPPTPPMHAGRWAPLGPRAEHLSATDACDAHQSYLSAPDMRCECMRGISVDDVKARVLSWRRAGERRAVPKSLGAGRPVGDEHRAGDPHER